MARESYIDSEIYRFLKNLQERAINVNGLVIQDIKFHYPIDRTEADIYVVFSHNGNLFSMIVETKRNKMGEQFDPFSPRVIGQALGYAKFIGAQFIVTCNGDLFLCFDIMKNLPILQCIVNDDIKLKYTETFFMGFLEEIERYVSDKKELKGLSERFIARLAYFHQIITPYFRIELEKNLLNVEYKKIFISFCEKRGYTYNDVSELTRWISEQSAYLLLNRLLFHSVLKNHYRNVPIIKKINGIKVSGFINELNRVFRQTVDEINYKIIFQKANIFDDIPISDELAYLLNDFVEELKEHNIALINEDVIGKVYELIIPEIDKHLKGQYYTPQWIADLIGELTIQNKDDKILDTSCGSGTFLVSAYNKLTEYPENRHPKIINQLTGIDINYFPAHLAAFNLIIRDITEKHDNLKILPIDFFKLRAGAKQLFPLDYLSITDDDEKKEDFYLTSKFDVVMTNPPYTESREIGDTKYKEFIRSIALDNNKQLAKSIGIYGYFYTHANHFLKQGGRIGFIVSNSFLETKGGKTLCQFFLDRFKIKYMIGFKTNVFEHADVKTIITVLEKCNDKHEREENTIKFVKVITDFNNLDVKNFVRMLEEGKRNHAEEDFSLVCVKQEALKDEESWMLYFKDFDQIDLFLRVFSTDSKKLSDVCGNENIRSCFKAGGYEFFFIKKEDNATLRIEPRYLENIIHTPRDYSKLAITSDDITKWLFKIESMTDLMRTRTNAREYARGWMEKEVVLKKGKSKGSIVTGIQNTPTFAGNSKWYRVFDDQIKGELLFQGYINRDMRCFVNECNAYSTANYVTIHARNPLHVPILALIFNSSLMHFYFENKGTILGANALYVANYVLSSSMIPNIDALPPQKITDAQQLFDRYKQLPFEGETFLRVQNEVDDFVFDIYGINEVDKNEIKKQLKVLVDTRLKGKDS